MDSLASPRSPFGRCPQASNVQNDPAFCRTLFSGPNPFLSVPVQIKRGALRPFLFELAEKEGFEPSMAFYRHTPLAGERLRPARPPLQIEKGREYIEKTSRCKPIPRNSMLSR